MRNAARPSPNLRVKYVDERTLHAKLEVAEARTATKFMQVLGKLDAIGERLPCVETKIDTVDGHLRNQGHDFCGNTGNWRCDRGTCPCSGPAL